MFLGGQPRHYICTNVSRGLSVIAEFLVFVVVVVSVHNMRDIGLTFLSVRPYDCLNVRDAVVLYLNERTMSYRQTF